MKLSITFLPAFLLLAAAIFSPGRADEIPAPIQAVMTPYLKIHDALAKDSLEGVVAAAKAIEQVTRDDKGKLLPSELVADAQILAGAKDLAASREAFKPLSAALIQVVLDNKVKTYTEVYCPMVQASWLQIGTTVSNPFGAAMAHCGTLVTDDAVEGGCCPAPAEGN